MDAAFLRCVNDVTLSFNCVMINLAFVPNFDR
jgi:hypothetical protein